VKKIFSLLTVVGIALAAFSWVGVTQAYAQTTTPPIPGVPTQTGQGSVVMSEYMLSSMASVFGLTVEELQTRLNSGETMYQIALAQGLTATDFYTKMAQARSEALKTAVTNGDITQDTASWIQSHMGGQGVNGAQGGSVPGDFGQSGQGGQGGRFGAGKP